MHLEFGLLATSSPVPISRKGLRDEVTLLENLIRDIRLVLKDFEIKNFYEIHYDLRTIRLIGQVRFSCLGLRSHDAGTL